MKNRQSLRIVRAQIIHFIDNEQTIAFITWSDGSRTSGDPENAHMTELLRRAEREHARLDMESWS